jgi:hypothetical protein
VGRSSGRQGHDRRGADERRTTSGAWALDLGRGGYALARLSALSSFGWLLQLMKVKLSSVESTRLKKHIFLEKLIKINLPMKMICFRVVPLAIIKTNE